MEQNSSGHNSRLISHHGFAEVREIISSGQKALFSSQPILKGDILIEFSVAETRTTPSYLTLQIGEDKHIVIEPTFIQNINHSCEPNCFFNTTSLQLVALRNIEVGEELNFFYPSSEWEMQQPFVCNCGATACLGEIRGAAHLSPSQAANYQLTEFIMRKRKGLQ